MTRIRPAEALRECCGTTLGECTVSIGVSTHAPKEGATDLIAREDAALYASKQRGRDCVTHADALRDKTVTSPAA